MTIYRVYSTYHDASESGTTEYGSYSSLEGAQDRVARVWTKKQYPDGYEDSSAGRHIHDGMDWYAIYIAEVEVDKDTDDDCCGYT